MYKCLSMSLDIVKEVTKLTMISSLHEFLWSMVSEE